MEWEFDIRKGGSRRADGLWFECRVAMPSDNLEPPSDFVWQVHWPNPALPPVWVNPAKQDCHTPEAVEAYCDKHFPVGAV